jgi:serine acetyltransferase
LIGDDVLIEGKCRCCFAVRYSERPQLIIGDGTGIGCHCSFVLSKGIRIGRHCRIAGKVRIFDSPGHRADPQQRCGGTQVWPEDVRPVVIEDNVWFGNNAIIFRGVTIESTLLPRQEAAALPALFHCAALGPAAFCITGAPSPCGFDPAALGAMSVRRTAACLNGYLCAVKPPPAVKAAQATSPEVV